MGEMDKQKYGGRRGESHWIIRVRVVDEEVKHGGNEGEKRIKRNRMGGEMKGNRGGRVGGRVTASGGTEGRERERNK